MNQIERMIRTIEIVHTELQALEKAAEADGNEGRFHCLGDALNALDKATEALEAANEGE
jgi:hypothetical protein